MRRSNRFSYVEAYKCNSFIFDINFSMVALSVFSLLLFCGTSWGRLVYYAPIVPKPKGGEVCYSAHGVSLGCFDNRTPFHDLPLPWDPQTIQPGFYLFSRQNSELENVKQLDLNLPIPSEFSKKRVTKLIIHGFLNSWESKWMHEMKDELLKEGDYNVILVGWGKGAQVPLFMYENAASNTRVVSAYLAKVIDMVVEKTGYKPENVHCIGHSLGAQTCGFAGKRVSPPINRISGLDPAGPNFKDKAKEGRLDASDANLVDIIHSNGKESLTIDFGIGEQLGDIDFVPNGGGMQPGCLNRRKRSTNMEKIAAGVAEQPACSHGRAVSYFTESINSNCQFIAAPCESMDVYEKGDCESCSGDRCQIMGYHANKRKGRGIFYVTTNDESPFCIN